MLNTCFPHDIAEEDKLDYRRLQLTVSLFTAFRNYWQLSIPATAALFEQHGLYDFISDNYDFYHTVGSVYAVEDIRECLNLPEGSWT